MADFCYECLAVSQAKSNIVKVVETTASQHVDGTCGYLATGGRECASDDRR